jgi:hypothetical protein
MKPLATLAVQSQRRTSLSGADENAPQAARAAVRRGGIGFAQRKSGRCDILLQVRDAAIPGSAA